MNNRTRYRFCNDIVILRIRPSVARDFDKPFSQLQDSIRSRVALGRIRKTITLLQNRDSMYNEEFNNI